MTLNNDVVLDGIVSALATPFTVDDSIDEPRLRDLVDRNIDGGVSGVVAGGSTGEFAAMTRAERRQLVEVVVDQAAGRVPVIAQTGTTGTREAVELSRHAEAAGAAVIMPVTPYYEALSIEETMRYLRTVAESVQVPVMLYNLPAATGVNLTPPLVRDLATSVENIAYVKDTTGDMAQLAALIHHQGDVISAFVGWDSLGLAALVEGAAGMVAGSANVVPRQLRKLYQLVIDGDLAGARELWDRLFPLLDAMLQVPFISAVKAACGEVGFPIGVPRPPVLELEPAAVKDIGELARGLTPPPA